MLPNKETNSSEESECDDLDPNTSMEVETIILVIIISIDMCLFWNTFAERGAGGSASLTIIPAN